MAPPELEKARDAIANADLNQVLELAAVIKARLESLGVTPEACAEVAFGPALMPGEPEKESLPSPQFTPPNLPLR
jgi:hypothetical protein